MEILKAILGVEAVNLAGRFVLRVVPNEEVVAVSKEDDWTLSVHFFKAVSVVLCLHLALLAVLNSLLSFHHAERFAAIRVLQHIICIPSAGIGWLMEYLDFLCYFRRVLPLK